MICLVTDRARLSADADAVDRLVELAAPYPSYADLARQLGEMAATAAPRNVLEQRLFRLNRLLG